jgi:hypothetical protein
MISNVRLLAASVIVATLAWLPAYAQPVNGTCGTKPQTCATGTVTGVNNNGYNTQWTCSGSNGGTSAWCIASDALPSPINGVCGTTANSCVAGTVTGSTNNGYNTQWTCSGSNDGTNAWCIVSDTVAPPPPPPVVATLAGTKLGINLGALSDWADRQMMFVDVMKDARGFATPAKFWDPTDAPVPLDANGWPTTDFGVMFLSNAGDPLNRPLSTTYPSLFGTYTLSFTGRATVSGAACCTIQNVAYNASTNTTTANVVVGPNDSQLALTFTGTNGGVQNVKLLRPGYALGTTQVFTNQFLKAIAPFSTLRLMDTLQTNSNPVTSWAQRTQPTTPQQSASSGLAWEYVIQLANASGKDIWINIPEGVDLTDPTSNNYATQLAKLLKANLNSGIHVYLEYSSELWATNFAQNAENLAAAISEVNSGADPSLNYDHSNNQTYWAYRRAMHQVERLSQLFQNVYGAAAINTTIRPLYLSQFVQPWLALDALLYAKNNLGAPSQFIYGIGGAPYFGPDSNTNYPTVASAVAALTSAVTASENDFPTQPYNGGGIVYSNISYKGLADYYGLKNVGYEGGPALTAATSAAINESVESSTALTPMIEGYLADWFGCGNDLFMYYDLAAPPGNIWGAYEDLSLATPKSAALNAVSATPLANYTTCAAP